MAGIRYIADALLANPNLLESEPAIHKYADAMDKDGGQSLSIGDMKDLAVQLALQTAKKEPGVGGANQIATFQKGRIASIEQAAFPRAPKPLVDFILMNSNDYESDATGFFNSESKFPSTKEITLGGVLFVKCHFSRYRVEVDNNYFSGDWLDNSVVIYDGSEAMHFGTNTVRNCILVIGPHAKRDSERVKHLVHDFTWLQVVYQEPKK